MPYHVPAAEFDLIATEALDSIPAELRDRLEADNLMITIQDTSTADDRDNSIDERVLGFFQGADQSTFSAYAYPKRIVLLQRHIENHCSNREELVAQVTDTVLHEVAHYFGLGHGDIAQTRLRH